MATLTADSALGAEGYQQITAVDGIQTCSTRLKELIKWPATNKTPHRR